MNLYHVDVRKAVQTGANVRRQLYNARDFATVKEDAIDNRLNRNYFGQYYASSIYAKVTTCEL